MSLHLTIHYETEVTSSDDDHTDPIVGLDVSRLHTVTEICQSIYKELKHVLLQSDDKYALYYPEKKHWLSDKPIGRELRGSTSARLEYKLKTSPVRIRFLDASSKTLLIDKSLTVKDVVKNICLQLKLDHPEELSLVVAVDYAVTKHHPANQGENKSPVLQTKRPSSGDTRGGVSPYTRRKQMTRTGNGGVVRPGSAGLFGRKKSTSQIASPVKKQISRKHQIRIDIPWLDPNKTLCEQDVTEDDELLLMYRFHYNMELDRGSRIVEMLYKQARATFLAGEMLCSSEDIPKFTALLCQISKGDFVSKEETHETLHKLKKLLAPPKLKTKAILKDVVAYYVLLKGLSIQDAKCWFVKLWSSMNLFGIEFISCMNAETKEKGLIGVSKNQILFLHHNTKKKSLKWNINSLDRWEYDKEKDVVTLHFSKDEVKLSLLLFEYSLVLLDCLQGHRDLYSDTPEFQLIQKEFQFDEEMEKCFSRYSTSSSEVKLRGHRRTGSITYNDVYWGQTIGFPLVSDEERTSWKSDSWENPLFENLDQLMEDRFSFLDFKEYKEEKSSPPPDQRQIISDSPSSSPYSGSERKSDISLSPQNTPTLQKGWREGVSRPSLPSPLLKANQAHDVVDTESSSESESPPLSRLTVLDSSFNDVLGTVNTKVETGNNEEGKDEEGKDKEGTDHTDSNDNNSMSIKGD